MDRISIKMTKEEYLLFVKHTFNETEESLKEINREVIPCKCGSPSCLGWEVVPIKR